MCCRCRVISILQIMLIAVFLHTPSNAQFLAIYDQNHMHEIIKNPATTGAELYPVLNLSFRKQWWGIQNAPGTQVVSFNLRLGKFDFYNPKMMLNKERFRAQEQSGLGAAVFHDRNGPLEYTGIMLTYAYHIPFEVSTLSFGLGGTLADYRINYALLNPDDPSDEALERKPAYVVLNANTGIYFYSEFYLLGFAATELFPVRKLDGDHYDKPRPNFFLTGGYRFKIVPGLLYEPTVEIRKSSQRDYTMDLNSKFYFGNAHYAGLNIRSDGMAGMYFGINVRKYIYICYLYEYSLGDISKAYNNTHTFMIGQNIGLRSFTAIRKMRFR